MSFRDHIELHTEVDSTMVVAAQRAADNAPCGTTVATSNQTAGRGRAGRLWHSPAGASLAATIILRPSKRERVDSLSCVSLLAGVATCQTIHSLGARDALLKWPNDVVAGERKLCGILTEALQLDSHSPIVLVGIGINLAARKELTLPFDIDDRYIGLADLMGDQQRATVQSILPVLLDHVEIWYRRWLTEGNEPIVRAWQRYDVLYGATVRAEAQRGPVVGRAFGLTEQGALRVVTKEGVSEITAGDVVRVRTVPEATQPC